MDLKYKIKISDGLRQRIVKELEKNPNQTLLLEVDEMNFKLVELEE